MDTKVTSIRYFKTRRGVGYEAKTQHGSIWNDGNGGGTYFESNDSRFSFPRELSGMEKEMYLESLIDKHEGIESLPLNHLALINKKEIVK
tara:strand:+ start:452 stop:721 length:270 start_codon:yes stop_codon:yes gene_type:complete